MTKAYQERILEYVRSVKSPVTTEQVAKALDISWQTAQLHLLNLANQDRINFQKIGRQNIFMKRALRAERNEYRGLFDSNPQPNVIFDRETLELLAVNDAFVNLAGFTRDDLIGMKMTYLLASEEDRELLALRVYRKRGFDDVPDGQAYRTLGIWNMTRKDGHPFLCEMMARPLQFDGKLANLVIAQPVQQIREPTMHPQEARFPLAAMLPAMLWTAKPDGTIDFANHLWYEYTGLTHAQTRENPWPHIVHPEDRERWESLVKRSKSTAEPFEEEFRLLRSDGTYRVHLARVTPVKDEKGRITMWAGCFLDHHKAHSAEQTVLQNASIERKFAELTNINRRILESTAEGIFGIDAAGNLTFMNPAAEEMTGWRAEELIGKQTHDIFHHTLPDGKEYAIENCFIQKTLRNAKTQTVSDEVFWRPDGTSFPVEYTCTPVMEDDKTLGAAVVFRDITERKRIEKELEFQQYALDKSSIVAITDANGTITYVNDKFCEISGFSRDELIGKNHRIINSGFHPREFFRDMYRTITKGTVWRGEIRNRRKDGSFYWVDTTIVPSMGANGRPERYVALRTDVTERKRQELEIAETKERMRLVTANVPALVSYIDRDMKYVFANHQYERWFGTPVEHIIGKTMAEVLGEKSFERIRGYLDKVLAGETVKYEMELPYRLGGARHVSASYTPHIVNDVVLGFFVLVIDITDRKKAEEELRSASARLSEERSQLEAVFQSMQDGVMVFDMRGKSILANAALARINGYGSVAEMMRDIEYFSSVYELSLPDGTLLPVSRWPVSRVLRGETITDWELRGRRRDTGREWFFSFSGEPVYDAQGKQVLAVTITRDITESKQAQMELQRSRDQLSIILQGVRDGITATTPDGRIIYANHTAARLCGFSTVDEMVSAAPAQVRERFEMLDGEGNPMGWDRVASRRALTGEIVHDQLTQFRVKATGEERWSLVSSQPVIDDDGKVSFVINIFRDITEQREAEAQRAEDILRTRLLSETLNDISQTPDYEPRLVALAENLVPKLADWCAIDMLDDTGEVHRIAVVHKNPEKIGLAQRLREMQPFDINAKSGLGKVLRTGQPEVTLDITWEMITAAVPEGEFRDLLRTLDLRSFIVMPLIARGKVLGAITLAMADSGRRYSQNDVKFVEEMARRAAISIDNARLYADAQQALAFRDDFLSIASHELKTPVTSIKAFLQALERRMARPENFDFEKNLQYMRLSVKQVDRLGAIINDLLDINRIAKGKMEYHFKTLSIGPIVADAVERMGVSFSAHRLNLKLQDLTTKVRVDELRFEQVLTNLITNAAKYSPEGSSIDIITRTDGTNVYIDVKDQGIGISATDQETIFERYYRSPQAISTRAGGLGVGLFISYELIKAHEGKIQVSSKVGEGSTFTIVLPCAEEC